MTEKNTVKKYRIRLNNNYQIRKLAIYNALYNKTYQRIGTLRIVVQSIVQYLVFTI